MRGAIGVARLASAIPTFQQGKDINAMKTYSSIATAAMMSAVGLIGPAISFAQDKVTYEDHIKPIFREHCLSCHNQNDAKGGLALDLFGKTMEGGSSGTVVEPGDATISRLFHLVTHEDEPVMPPGQDKMAQAKLDLIQKWIDGGALENSGSVAMKPKKPLISLGNTEVADDGPTPLPETVFLQSVVATERSGAVTAMAASPGAPFVAVAGQRQIVLTHVETGELLGVLPFPEGQIESIRFSRNGAFLIVGGGYPAREGFVALYDIKTGDRKFKLGDELDAVLGADINNDFSLVALGGPSKLVKILSTQTGDVLHELKKHTDWVYDVAFSPDGVLLATADRSGGLVVWESMNGQPYLDLRGHSAAVTSVAWRGDSNVLASASEDGTVRLWEMNEGKEIKKWNAHGGGVQSIRYNRQGNLVTTGRDNKAKYWDPSGGLKKEVSLADIGMRAELSFDTRYMVTGDWLGHVKVWKVEDGKEQFAIDVNPPKIADRIGVVAKDLEAASAAEAKARSEFDQAKASVEQKEKERVAKEAAVAAADAELKTLADQKNGLQGQRGSLDAAERSAGENLAKAEKARDEARKALETKAKALTDAEANRRGLAERVRKALLEAGLDEKSVPAVTDANALFERYASTVLEVKDAAIAAETKAAEATKQAESVAADAEDEAKQTAKTASDEATTARDQAKAKLVSLEPLGSEIAKAVERVASAVKERDGAEAVKAQAEDAVGPAQKSVESAKDAVAALVAELKATEQKAKELSDKKPTLKKAAEDAVVYRDQAEKSRQTKQAAWEQAEIQVSRLRAMHEKLIVQQDTLAKELNDARSRVTALAEQEAELSKAAEAVAAKVEAAEKAAAERQAEMERLTAEMNALKERLAKVETAKAEAAAAHQSAQEAANAAQSKLGELLSEKEEVTSKATLLEKSYGQP